MPALVIATKLSDFEGAPFAEQLVASAGELVRSEAGWHIAPPVTETVTVESDGGPLLLLPSLQVTAVTAVRHVGSDLPLTDLPVALTGWRFRRNGTLVRWYGWPRGDIEVDVTHGYAECPAELLPVVAERTRGTYRVSRENLGPAGMSYDLRASYDPVSRYTLPTRP